jgi:hypothetical protein
MFSLITNGDLPLQEVKPGCAVHGPFGDKGPAKKQPDKIHDVSNQLIYL